MHLTHLEWVISEDGHPTLAVRNRRIKHLPYSELMRCKAKGLCFRCGERYHPLHQCTEKQLRLLILGDEETVKEEGEVIVMEVKDDEVEEEIECFRS